MVEMVHFMLCALRCTRKTPAETKESHPNSIWTAQVRTIFMVGHVGRSFLHVFLPCLSKLGSKVHMICTSHTKIILICLSVGVIKIIKQQIFVPWTGLDWLGSSLHNLTFCRTSILLSHSSEILVWLCGLLHCDQFSGSAFQHFYSWEVQPKNQSSGLWTFFLKCLQCLLSRTNQDTKQPIQ